MGEPRKKRGKSKLPGRYQCRVARFQLVDPSSKQGHWWKVCVRQPAATKMQRSAVVYYMAPGVELPVRQQEFYPCTHTMTVGGAIKLIERTIELWEGTGEQEAQTK